jgi:hypothetical protein
LRRKLTGSLKLFHDKFARNMQEHEAYAAEFQEALQHNEQIKSCLNKVIGSRNGYKIRLVIIALRILFLASHLSYIFELVCLLL